MFTADQLKKLPNLPASTDKLPNGKYVVPCHDEKATYGEGSDIVYEKWFQTPVSQSSHPTHWDLPSHWQALTN